MRTSNTSRVRFRPFRIRDAADICRIYPMFFVDNAVHFARGFTTVADRGGQVVGFVLWAPAFEPAWFDRNVRRWAELHELHVRPEFQNRGIGFRLVRKAIEQAADQGYPVMYLLTEDSNIAAHRVYEKAGFRPHNRITRYKRDARFVR
jgi:ribosomal protein S18 acetylase RimI-like enzyme